MHEKKLIQGMQSANSSKKANWKEIILRAKINGLKKTFGKKFGILITIFFFSSIFYIFMDSKKF